MKQLSYLLILFILGWSNPTLSQSIDDPLSQRKMRKDLELFKNIREATNSGLYTYRSEKQIDSVYNWAFEEINHLGTYRDFYNLISLITDYEGSLHNGTYWPNTLSENIGKESEGYFPIPLKIIEGKLVVNSRESEIPLGSEVLSINGNQAEQLFDALGKYYTTDGFNQTGKELGIGMYFSKYYRYHYGLADKFTVVYQEPNTNTTKEINLKSVGNSTVNKSSRNRHSKSIDDLLYSDFDEDKNYSFEKIDSETAILTVNTFALNPTTYKKYLDSVFTDMKTNQFKNLIVDIRNNGGGDKPNDMLTLAYLADTPQKEIAEAWISFTDGFPYWRHFQIDIPWYQKPIAKAKLKKYIQSEVPIVKNNRRYYRDIEVYEPEESQFQGQVYVLIGPGVASAASLFAASVSSNTDAILIGEETMGGYYGHNGAFPVEYKLPRTKFSTVFSVANLTQDVMEKESQPFGRGVMPDYKIEQTFEDFMENKDTQMEFVLNMIRENSAQNQSTTKAQ